MIRVLIADDQQLVRDGTRLILESEFDIRVVGEAASGNEAVTLAQELAPDVVLMDIRMPDGDGISATRLIASREGPAPAVVVLTLFGEDQYLFGALEAGAVGFLLKDADADQMLTAVRLAAETGAGIVSPELIRRVLAEFRRRKARRGREQPDHGVALTDDEIAAEAIDLARLTPREVEVIRAVGAGMVNSEIALLLQVEVGSVKNYLNRVLKKLRAFDVHNRAQIVAWAMRNQLTR